MKFSFEILRGKSVGEALQQQRPTIPTGDMIRSRVVDPSHARLLRQAGQRMQRMYDAAITTNLNLDFGVTTSSANAEIQQSQVQTRSRARKLERDNPFVWSILNGFQNDVGGDEPFRLEMNVGKYDAAARFVKETETNRKIMAWWKKAGMPEYCTVSRTMSRRELYWQAIAAFVRDGGILWKHYKGFNNRYRYAVEPIEVDRLDNFYMRPRNQGQTEILFSIELDQYKAPIAYWILSRHPGDVFSYGTDTKYRVREDAADIIALWDIRTRAGQVVGISRIASIIQKAHRKEQFDIAHATAAIMAAARPMFITRPKPTPSEYTGDDESKEGEKYDNFEPGSAQVLPDGYEAQQLDVKFPNEAADKFGKEQLRAMASGTGSIYHRIGQDLEGVNFSSGRLGENAYHDECKKLQAHFIDNAAYPHFCMALKYALMSGELELPFSRYEEFCDAASIHGRRWPYVNPLQDVQADVLAIEAGLTSRSRVIADSERGGDVEEVDGEVASDRQCDEDHDLDFSGTDPTKPDVKKGEPGEWDDNPEDGKTSALDSAPGKTGSKQTLRGINWERLQRTLKILADTEPEFKQTPEMDALIERRRRGELNGRH